MHNISPCASKENLDPFFVLAGSQSLNFRRDKPVWLAIRLPLIALLDADVAAAQVASQLAYYTTRGKDGRWQRSLRQLATDCGLSLRTVERCAAIARDRGLFERAKGGWWSATPTMEAIPGPSFRLHRAAPWIAGDAAAGLILQRICWWFRPGRDGLCKATIRIDGEGPWVAKSVRELAVELRLGTLADGVFQPATDRVRQALARLADRGLIASHKQRYAGHPTIHYRPLNAVIRSRLAAYAEQYIDGPEKPPKSQMETTEIPNGNHRNPKCYIVTNTGTNT